MGNFLKFLPKLIPLLPQLISGIARLVGVFKKKHDPAELAKAGAEEVKKLQDHKAAASEEDWNIVKGED